MATTPTLRLALPKGRLTERTLDMFRSAGIDIDDERLANRKLIHDISDVTMGPLGCGMELLLLKNTDVPIYVEHGVADLGVAGTDVLYESAVQVHRPYTFGFGSCAICITAPRSIDVTTLQRRPHLRVATKYKRYARDTFAKRGRPVEIIPLSGSVELAPSLGLADVILDLVETGQTMIDNGLEVIETVGQTSVKLIANRTLGRPRTRCITRLIERLEGLERA